MALEQSTWQRVVHIGAQVCDVPRNHGRSAMLRIRKQCGSGMMHPFLFKVVLEITVPRFHTSDALNSMLHFGGG